MQTFSMCIKCPPSNLHISSNSPILLKIHSPESLIISILILLILTLYLGLLLGILDVSLIRWFLPGLFLKRTKPNQPPQQSSIVPIVILHSSYSCFGYIFEIVSTAKQKVQKKPKIFFTSWVPTTGYNQYKLSNVL